MSLNRNSTWTTKEGLVLKVRDMRLLELTTAILYVETLQFDASFDDPYIVQNICMCEDPGHAHNQPCYAKDGHSLDDWYELLNAELAKRADLIEKRLFHPKEVPTKTTPICERLANMLKIW